MHSIITFIYIQNNLFLSFCPSPNCHYIINVDPGLQINIKCKCGSFSCSKCKLLQPHTPCPCKIANKWILKSSSDQENVQWILASTKKCPKCKVAIEKNQGCNHMTCAKCNHEFCWLCKQPWNTHGSITGGFYKCNIYQKQIESGYVYDEEKKQQTAKAELERYSFYFVRYDNHLNAARVAEKEMNNKHYKDMDYIINAYSLIIDCRNLLAFTYVIKYFLPSHYQKLPLFDQQQTSLESYTEHLHELLEGKIDKNNNKNNHNKNNKNKQNNDSVGELNNFTRSLKKFEINMTKAVEEIGNDLLEIMQL